MADEADNRRLIREESASGRSYQLFNSPAAKVAHVDGISGFSFGPAFSRIDFHEVKRIDEGKGFEGQPLEIREQNLTVVLPTIVFAEFLTQAVSNLRSNEAVITQGFTAQLQAIETFIKMLGKTDASDQ
jgi:hypothetical protein